MSEKVLPSSQGSEKILPNSRPFGWFGRVPVAVIIGGVATVIGAGAAELMGDSPTGVAIACGLATVTVTAFNRKTLNDPLDSEQLPLSATSPEVIDLPPAGSEEPVCAPDIDAGSNSGLE